LTLSSVGEGAGERFMISDDESVRAAGETYFRFIRLSRADFEISKR
jgi:hypothetical protein